MYLSIVAGGGPFELVGAGVTVTGGGVGEGVVGPGAGVSALEGAGVTGATDGQEAHQHCFPPFPHPSVCPAVEQLPPASCPSAQIEESKG